MEVLWRKLSGQDEKMQTLTDNFQALNSRAADVKTEVEDAELQTGKNRKHEVENWLRTVARMNNEVKRLEQEVKEKKISSFSLGNRIDKLKKEIVELLDRGSFQGGLLLDVCETRGEPLLATKLTGQAVEQNLEKIRACLMDDKVLRIGICGMGGVGKTSLAVASHNDILENSKISDCVVWCTVSKDHDYSIGKLQSDIAKCLKLDLSTENDEKKRAATLSQAFARRGKCVLFLDDVWDKIDPHRVGIPDGCKLILTTRSFDVCRKIGCEVFKVEPLSEEEARNLFWKKLCNGEGTALSSDIKDIAKSVVAKCGGLPLGIITMAGSMRGVGDICEWRNVLEELKKLTMGHDDMEKDVLPILKLSYSRLNDMKLQLCFLSCALYPEDCRIRRHELIRYFIAEGRLLDERKSLQAKFDQGHAMLNKLERSCLLESCVGDEGERCVKMHDLIRDMALKITKESHPRFMVKAGLRLNEIPDEQEWTGDLDKVSLMKNDIKEIPQGRSPMCPRLSTLTLVDNPLYRIADSFFEHMHALQLLDLSLTGIKELPNSISNLKNLTALLLEGCSSLTHVPPLGNLTALRELDLSFTAIQKVPQGVEKLVNLNILNMEGTLELEMIPNGTLGRLSRLQHIKLHSKSGHIAVQVEELEGMTDLEGISVDLGNIDGFNQFAQVLDRCGPWLNKYALSMNSWYGSIDFIRDHYNYNKFVKLQYLHKRDEKYGFLIPHDIEVLKIESCSFASSSSLCDVFPTWNSNSRHLKVIRIKSCSGINCISPLRCLSPSSSSTSSHNEEREVANEEDQLGENSQVPFRSLEILQMIELPDLWTLFWSNMLGLEYGLRFEEIAPPYGTFSSLKELYISNCEKINCLCSPGLLLRHLSNLETIAIHKCDQMEEIFDEDEGMRSIFLKNNDGNNHNTTITLPKLKSLVLCELKELKSICEGKMVCDSIEIIKLSSCPKLKRLPFSLPLVNGQPSAPKALKEINIENIFFKNNDGNNHNTIITLPKLKSLALFELKELKSICEGKMVCDSIEIIAVKHCPKLKRLPFSLPLVNGKPSAPKALKKIYIENIDWWESLEWEQQSANDVLGRFLRPNNYLIGKYLLDFRHEVGWLSEI